MHLLNPTVDVVILLVVLGGIGYFVTIIRCRRRSVRIVAEEATYQERKAQAAEEQRELEIVLEDLLVFAEGGNRTAIDQFRRNDYKSYNGVLERDAKQRERFIEVVFRPLIVTWQKGTIPKERFEAIKSLIQALNAYNDPKRPMFYRTIREALELPGSLEDELSIAFDEYTNDLCAKARGDDSSAFSELLKIHRANQDGWSFERLSLTHPTDWNDLVARWRIRY